MGTMTKWPVQKQTHRKTKKHVGHQEATDIQKKTILSVVRICNDKCLVLMLYCFIILNGRDVLLLTKIQ